MKINTIKLGLEDKITQIFSMNKRLSKNKNDSSAHRKIKNNREAINKVSQILTSIDEFKNNLYLTNPETQYSPEAFNEHFENFLSDTLHESLNEALEHEPALIVSDSLLNLKINPYRNTPKYKNKDKDWVEKGMSGSSAFFLGMFLSHKSFKIPFGLVIAALACTDEEDCNDLMMVMLISSLLARTDYKPESNMFLLKSYLHSPTHIDEANKFFKKATENVLPSPKLEITKNSNIGWKLPKPEFDERKTKK